MGQGMMPSSSMGHILSLLQGSGHGPWVEVPLPPTVSLRSSASLLQPGGGLFSGTVFRMSLVFLFPAVPGLATAVFSAWRLAVLHQ